jgi:hypothetical protein
MQILFGKMVGFALGAVARLRVADQLAAGPMSASDAAVACGANADALYRVLRTLASVGVFSELPGKRFELTPVGQMLRSDTPGSMRNMVLMMNDVWNVHSYLKFTHCIQTGADGVHAAHGKGIFDLFRDIPEEAETFHRAMTDLSAIAARALLEVHDFSRFRRLADVGGGHGVLLGSILRKHGALEGILFDLPEVLAGAPGAGHLAGVEGRVTLVEGSFFEHIPGGCDAYIMKHIVHDWDDGSCRRILSLMREQLQAHAPRDGRVFLFEMVVPDGPEPAPAKFLDMEMLVVSPGGKERTVAEFEALFSAAGLRLVSVTPTPSPMSLIEAAVA